MPQAAPVRASARLGVATFVGGVWGMPRTLRPALAGVVDRRLDIWLTVAGERDIIRADETAVGIGPLGDGGSPHSAVRSADGAASITAPARGLAHYARRRCADSR